MIALSKSSPSRADNFPPPLMGIMRINGGEKSRARSRRSPVIHARRRRVNSAKMDEATQEPSSPKVTCIGQVRGSRSAANRRRPCWLLEKTRTLWVLVLWSRRRCEKTGDAPGGFVSPPENDVVLARCGSGPYKPSSLGGLLWGSNGFRGLEGCSSAGGAVHPLLLTRCDSDPARGESACGKRDFSRERRFGTV